MTVNQIPFADVFDSTVSYAPKAIVGMPLEDIVSRRHLQVEEGKDGLDAFSAVPMVLEMDRGRRLKFALWRHQGNPEGTFAIHFGLPELDAPGLLGFVLHELEIPEQAVIWRASESAAASQAEPSATRGETIVAVYDIIGAAEAATEDLKAAGVPEGSIGLHAGPRVMGGGAMSMTGGIPRPEGFWSSHSVGSRTTAPPFTIRV